MLRSAKKIPRSVYFLRTLALIGVIGSVNLGVLPASASAGAVPPKGSPKEPDIITYAKEPIVLTRKEADSALRRALVGKDYDLAKRMSTLLFGGKSNKPTKGTGGGKPLVIAKPSDAYSLLRPLGKELRGEGPPVSWIRPAKPINPKINLSTDAAFPVGGNRFGLDDIDDPPGDDDGDPPGDPGDPGGPGGSGLDAWEATFTNPRDLLLAIPPSSLVGVYGSPDIRAQIKWRNHSMQFWRAYYGDLHVNSSYDGVSINWIKVWYEQTHLESFRKGTIFGLGMGSDGFQNHGGAHPSSGEIYNGPNPLTLEQLPPFFDLWNEDNPKPMPEFLSDEFIGSEYEREFGFMYPPPNPDASGWFLRWLEAVGSDWEGLIHPILDNAPYIWTIVNFSLVNVPDDGIDPPPGPLPPLFGMEGQTAGTILAAWNDLRFDIRRRLDNGESAFQIVSSYAGAAGVAGLSYKFQYFVRTQLTLMQAAGITPQVAEEYRDSMLAFVIEHLCVGNGQPHPACGGLYEDLVDLLDRFIKQQTVNEFTYRIENDLVDNDWLADMQILIQGLSLDVQIELIAGLEDIKGWPPDGLQEFNGFAILTAFFLNNGEHSELWQLAEVWGSDPGGFLAWLRNFFHGSDQWEDYIPGAPPPGPPGPGGLTDAELLALAPALGDLVTFAESGELDGWDPSWKVFFNLLKTYTTERMRVEFQENPDLLIEPTTLINSLANLIMKGAARDIIVDYMGSQGLDMSHPAASHLFDLFFSSAWEGMVDGVIRRGGPDAFFFKFGESLASRLGVTPTMLETYGKYSKWVGRGNFLITAAEVFATGIKIYNEWQQYQTTQLADELNNGLMLYQGSASGRFVTASQWHYERLTGLTSWNIDPIKFALWAAGQEHDGYSGPVTLFYDNGPPPPTAGFDNVEGVWTYGWVHPPVGFAPPNDEPSLDAGIPDLHLDDVTVTVVPVGTDLRATIKGKVKNSGTGRAAASVVEFHWSNSNGSSGHFSGHAVQIPALDPGSQLSFTEVIVQPDYLTMVPATYYLHCVADGADALFEWDEGNNSSPDLFAVTID